MTDVGLRSDAAGEEGATDDERECQHETAERGTAEDHRGRARTARWLHVLERLVDDLEVEGVGHLEDARHHTRAIDPSLHIGDARLGILHGEAQLALLVLVRRE